MQNFTCLFRGKCALLLTLLFALALSTQALAQETITVTGVVTSKEDKSTAPGVTVTLKGTTQGTATDASGKYSFRAKPGAVLVFSGVGYQTFEATVSGSVLNVGLDSKTNALNEVVVIGYGTTTRQNITTSVAKVDPKNVPQAANSSVPELLFGRASGLQVTQSSTQPGGNINLSIRGRGTPLYVVDGVIYPNNSLDPTNGSIAQETNNVNRGGLAGLNPQDIESIEVLKDASAAIYGVNAANGVVLITTKKGKSGRMNISYDGSHSVTKNYPYLQPLNATEYETVFNQLATDYTAGSKPTLFTPAQIAAAGVGTNWLDQVFQTGHVDNQLLSINGGTEKTTYYFSGGYFNQAGTVKESGLRKFSGRANLGFNLTKFLTLNANFTGVNNAYQNTSAGGQNGNSGTQGFGVVQAALGYPGYVPVRTATGAYSQFALIPNPVSLLDVQDRTYDHSLATNISADIKIIPGALTAHVLFGDNYETAKRDFFVPSTTYYYSTYEARGSLNYNDRENQTIEGTLSYKKDFLNRNLNIDAVAGMGQYKNMYSAFGAQGASIAGGADAIGTNNLTLNNDNLGISSSKFEGKTRSYFIRTNFNVLDRYLVSASLRYDGYSLFFPQSKYAAFPSVSLGWKINSESFLKDVTAINLLKLRASVGTTGSTIAAAAYGGYSPDGNFLFFNQGSVSYVTIARYAVDHPDLTWQKTINKNIGLDYELFNHRITGSVDVFQDDITNLLNSTGPTAPLDYLSTQPVNGGHQVRSGYDISLNTDNIRAKNFSWNTTINVSHFVYRWKERFPFYNLLAYGGVTYQQADDPYNEIYYFKTKGILQAGQAVPASQPTLGGANLPGAPIFVDKNGDGKLDGDDIYKVNPDPKITLGFGNTFRYKQLDLSVMFYGQFGGKSQNYNYTWADPLAIVSKTQNGTVQALDIYSSAHPSGTRPGVNYTESATGLPQGSDINLVSTNFVRCRNITFGYTFNSAFLNKFTKSVRVYADVQNAFTITNYKGVDPEVYYNPYSKGGYAPYPQIRTFSVGIKAGF